MLANARGGNGAAARARRRGGPAGRSRPGNRGGHRGRAGASGRLRGLAGRGSASACAGGERPGAGGAAVAAGGSVHPALGDAAHFRTLRLDAAAPGAGGGGLRLASVAVRLPAAGHDLCAAPPARSERAGIRGCAVRRDGGAGSRLARPGLRSVHVHAHVAAHRAEAGRGAALAGADPGREREPGCDSSAVPGGYAFRFMWHAKFLGGRGRAGRGAVAGHDRQGAVCAARRPPAPGAAQTLRGAGRQRLFRRAVAGGHRRAQAGRGAPDPLE